MHTHTGECGIREVCLWMSTLTRWVKVTSNESQQSCSGV